MSDEEFKFSGVEGVIQHKRPESCPGSGKRTEPIVIKVGAEGAKARKATCPECSKELWLNRIEFTDGAIGYYFPEHIGKTADA